MASEPVIEASDEAVQAVARTDGSVSVGCNSNPRGLSGPQLGAGSGQSIFMDKRAYGGDDVRRTDWNATARTDQLLIKRYEEEKTQCCTFGG